MLTGQQMLSIVVQFGAEGRRTLEATSATGRNQLMNYLIFLTIRKMKLISGGQIWWDIIIAHYLAL